MMIVCRALTRCFTVAGPVQPHTMAFILARRAIASAGLLLTLLMTASGCQAIGLASRALPAPQIQPKYEKLAGQSIAVMVWADRGLRIDYPRIQLDLAGTIQKDLQTSKAKQMKEATWPWPPESVARYQRDHPEIEGLPVVEVAPRIPNITRLIYIEIDDFATRSDMHVELYRGRINGTIKVVEISDGEATLAYEEQNVTTLFPRQSPREGLPNVNEMEIYAGTLREFATEVVHRFVPYTEED